MADIFILSCAEDFLLLLITYFHPYTPLINEPSFEGETKTKIELKPFDHKPDIKSELGELKSETFSPPFPFSYKEDAPASCKPPQTLSEEGTHNYNT